MHRLQSVAHVRQSAAHDHTHGVVEIRAAHFLFDGNRGYVATPITTGTTTLAGLFFRRLCIVRIGQIFDLQGNG